MTVYNLQFLNSKRLEEWRKVRNEQLEQGLQFQVSQNMMRLKVIYNISAI